MSVLGDIIFRFKVDSKQATEDVQKFGKQLGQTEQTAGRLGRAFSSLKKPISAFGKGIGVLFEDFMKFDHAMQGLFGNRLLKFGTNVLGFSAISGILGGVLSTLGGTVGAVGMGLSSLSSTSLILIGIVGYLVKGFGDLAQAIGTRLLVSTRNWLAAAMEMQEVMFGLKVQLEGYQKLVGKATLSADEYVDSAIEMTRTTGVSTREIMLAHDVLFSMSRIMGLTSEQIIKLIEASVDYTAALGRPGMFLDMIQGLEGAFVGYWRMLRNMGVDLSQHSAFVREAAKAYGEQFDSLTLTQKAVVLYNAFMKQVTYTQGKAAEMAAVTLPGAMRKFHSTIELIRMKLGQDITGIWKKWYDVLNVITERIYNLDKHLLGLYGKIYSLTGAFLYFFGALVKVAMYVTILGAAFGIIRNILAMPIGKVLSPFVAAITFLSVKIPFLNKYLGSFVSYLGKLSSIKAGTGMTLLYTLLVGLGVWTLKMIVAIIAAVGNLVFIFTRYLAPAFYILKIFFYDTIKAYPEFQEVLKDMAKELIKVGRGIGWLVKQFELFGDMMNWLSASFRRFVIDMRIVGAELNLQAMRTTGMDMWGKKVTPEQIRELEEILEVYKKFRERAEKDVKEALEGTGKYGKGEMGLGEGFPPDPEELRKQMNAALREIDTFYNARIRLIDDYIAKYQQRYYEGIINTEYEYQELVAKREKERLEVELERLLKRKGVIEHYYNLDLIKGEEYKDTIHKLDQELLDMQNKMGMESYEKTIRRLKHEQEVRIDKSETEKMLLERERVENQNYYRFLGEKLEDLRKINDEKYQEEMDQLEHMRNMHQVLNKEYIEEKYRITDEAIKSERDSVNKRYDYMRKSMMGDKIYYEEKYLLVLRDKKLIGESDENYNRRKKELLYSIEDIDKQINENEMKRIWDLDAIRRRLIDNQKKGLQEINEYMRTQLISVWDAFREKMIELEERGKSWRYEFGTSLAELGYSLRDRLVDPLEETIENIKNAEEAWRSFAATFLRELSKMFLRYMVLQPMFEYLGGRFPTLGKYMGTRQSGGSIHETGLYQLHKGERVLSADAVRAIGGTKIINQIDRGERSTAAAQPSMNIYIDAVDVDSFRRLVMQNQDLVGAISIGHWEKNYLENKSTKRIIRGR